MAAVQDSTCNPNTFPTKSSNPTAYKCLIDPATKVVLDARATYVNAQGYTVNRVTGAVTAP